MTGMKQLYHTRNMRECVSNFHENTTHVGKEILNKVSPTFLSPVLNDNFHIAGTREENSPSC